MAAATGQSPNTVTVRQFTPAVTLAADAEYPVYINDQLGGVVTVTAVNYYGVAAFTGAVTQNRTFNVFNRLATGLGTVLVATLNMTNGVNLVQWVGKAIPLSGTAANLDLAVGDVLTWQSLHIGTGIADPGGTVEITVSRA